MALTPIDVEADFAGLQLDRDASGYGDNEAAAAWTINPDDSSADLADLGRIDGYVLAMLDQQESSGLRFFSVRTSVDLFDTPASARAFVQREIEDVRRFEGVESLGSTYTFQELDSPDVDTNAVAWLLRVRFAGSEQKVYFTQAMWVRGPIVAAVVISEIDSVGILPPDRTTAINSLAQEMNQRIDGVLKGEISAIPIPTPPPEIRVTPGAIGQILAQDQTDVQTLHIYAGDSDIAWNVTESPAVEWLLVTPTLVFTIREPGTSGPDQIVREFEVTFDPTGLPAGDYTTVLEIAGSDPNVVGSVFAIPVALTVTEESVSQAGRTTDCESVEEIPQEECHALIALYNSTGGLGWQTSTGWGTTDTPCSWYGVRCERAMRVDDARDADLGGHVFGIELNDNQLSGAIPPELGALANLGQLDLDNNQLSGAIPPELGGLANLWSLDLRSNQLSGTIPPELGGAWPACCISTCRATG